MTTQTKELKEHELEQFTGTDHYYRHWTKAFVATDGVQFLSERGGAWIVDLVASYQTAVLLEEVPFQVWEIKIVEKEVEGIKQHGFHAIMTDGNGNKYRSQEGEFTDLQFDLKLYLIADPVHKAVLLLPSEY